MARTQHVASRKPAPRRPVADVVRQPAVKPVEHPLTLDQRMLRAIWIDLIGGLSIVPPGRAPEVVDKRIAALRHEGDQP